MSTPPLLDEVQRDYFALGHLVQEMQAFGVRFRLSGADVVIDGFERLPPLLQNEFECYRTKFLWFLLGGEELDIPALDFLDRLGVEAVLVETAKQAVPAIRGLLRDAKAHGGIAGLDIETAPLPGLVERPHVALNKDGVLSAEQPKLEDRTGLIPHLATIQTLQLYGGGSRCWVFRKDALQHVLQSYWFRALRLVAHNLSFEVAFLMQYSPRRRLPHRHPRGSIDCTMQMGGLMHGVGWGRSRSLEAIAKAELGFAPPKELQTSDWAAERLSPGQIAYAASDAILAFRLFVGSPGNPGLPAKLKQPVGPTAKGSRWNAYQLQKKVIPAVAAMELRGLAIDREEHRRQVELWERELAGANRAFLEATGKPPPANDNQVLAWLEELQRRTPLRFARWPRTPSGQLSTRAAHLKRLVDIASARHVLAIRAKRQLINNFGPKLITHISPITGRIHCHYNIASTKAGRFSAEAPNPQQLPNKRAREFKQCIVAGPGNLLVCCDWSQIEMRIFAWISSDPVLTRIYADGRDIHRETASFIAGVPPDQVTAQQRDCAKPVNFGAVYGIGPKGLCENAWADYGIDLSEAEAERWLRRFFDRFRVANNWRYRHRDLCQARGYVEIGLGRIVRAEWEEWGLSFQQCCNLPVQGAGADCLMVALSRIHTVLREGSIRGGLVACVHDEILLEVHEDDAELACAVLEDTMTIAFRDYFPGAPLNGVATAKIGRTWAEAKA